MPDQPYAELTQLGQPVALPQSPQEAQLETFVNPHPDLDYVVRLSAPEFTTLCPLTGQPDFATLIVDYVPHQRLVESKSFKLFLASFRNHGAFHEDCTVYVHKRLQAGMEPKYLRVVGLWAVRGGITIDVVAETGELPAHCRPLPLENVGYRGGRQ
jgi:7-cyano-7-deazaguanine reductase